MKFANESYQPWDGRPNCGHFFGGAYWYGMETSTACLVMAIAATLGDYDETVAGVPRAVARERAIGAIRYLGFTHDGQPNRGFDRLLCAGRMAAVGAA